MAHQVTRKLKAAFVVALLFLYTAGVSELSRNPDSVIFRNLSPFVWLFDGVPAQATYIPTPIQSISEVTATFSGGSTTATGTIGTTLVSASNAVLIYQGHYSSTASGIYAAQAFVRGAITSTSQVTATSGGTPSATSIWRGRVVEFVGTFVRGGACNTIAIANGSDSNTATLSITSAAKTIVVLEGGTTTSSLTFDGALGADVESEAQMNLSLSGTTLTATWQWNINNSRPASRVVGYCYVELR